MAYADRLDPNYEPGRLAIVARMGHDKVQRVHFLRLCRTVEASGHKVIWAE